MSKFTAKRKVNFLAWIETWAKNYVENISFDAFYLLIEIIAAERGENIKQTLERLNIIIEADDSPTCNEEGKK